MDRLPPPSRRTLEELPSCGEATLASLASDGSRLAAVAVEAEAERLGVTTLRGVGGYSVVFNAAPVGVEPCVLKVPWVPPRHVDEHPDLMPRGHGPNEVRLVSVTGPFVLRSPKTVEEAEWLLDEVSARQRETGAGRPLARLLDQRTLGGLRCALFERIDGPSLRHLMRVNLDEARTLVGPLARALGALQATFGAHGDLKPEHVLWEAGSNELVLIDPACAAGFVGSIGYTLGQSPMSPDYEAWLVARSHDPAEAASIRTHAAEVRTLADLAALAVTIAELWGGDPRWSGRLAYDVANQGNGRFAGNINWITVRENLSNALKDVPARLRSWAEEVGLRYIDCFAESGYDTRIHRYPDGWCRDRLSELADAAAALGQPAPRPDRRAPDAGPAELAPTRRRERAEPPSSAPEASPTREPAGSRRDESLGPDTWDAGSAGTARVVEQVYAGRCFEVYRLDAGGRPLALKVPLAVRGPKAPVFGAERALGGISTVFDVMCRAGWSVAPASEVHAGVERPAGLEDLLRDEARRLEVAGRSWNHELVALGRGALGGRAGQLGLVMPWQAGVRFDTLSRDQRRTLFVRMLPALWDALSVALHGDLHGSNIMLAADRSWFALIDPGAQVLIQRGPSGPSQGADTLTFITTPESYPVLPPYYCPDRPLASGATLRDRWEGFLRSMTRSDQYPPFHVGQQVVGHAISRSGGRFLTKPTAAAGEPHPADLVAAGVIYYQALTGTHPFPEALAAPAWFGITCVDDQLEGTEPISAWLPRRPVPPGEVDSTVNRAENDLALALLDLQVPSRERLLRLVGPVLAALG